MRSVPSPRPANAPSSTDRRLTRRGVLLSAASAGLAGTSLAVAPTVAAAATSTSPAPLRIRSRQRRVEVQPPALAVGAGYTNKVFDEAFTSTDSIDLTGAGMAGKRWSTKLPWGGTRTPASKLTTTPDGLRIDQAVSNQNIALLTIDPSTGQGTTFGHGYFEIRMRFAPDQPSAQAGFPALWLAPKSQMYHQVEPIPCGEIDMFEAYRDADHPYTGTFVGTVHDVTPVPGGNWEFSREQNRNNVVDAHIDGAWHTYAVLWEPGRVRWYLDGQVQVDVAFGPDRRPNVPTINWATGEGNSVGAFSILEEPLQQEMVLMMGTAPGWPIEVDWVRVWS